MKLKRVIKGKDLKAKFMKDEEGYVHSVLFLPSIYNCQKEKIVYDFDTDTYKVYDK